MNPGVFLLLKLMSVVIISVIYGGPVVAADTRAVSAGIKNPHGADSECSFCHVASADSLNSWFSFGSTKRALIADPVSLCQKCHGVDFGHGVGKKPAINRAKLPLTADGTINCALTCHDMHAKDPIDAIQKRYYLRLPPIELCASCHNK